MSGRYERVRCCSTVGGTLSDILTCDSQVNNLDNEEPDTPTSPTNQTPNSPPPSFHSRASSLISRERNEPVDSTLADAFDSDGDDEPDDRQRLVRGNSFPVNSSPPQTGNNANNNTQPPVAAQRQVPQPGGSRVYGGGIQSDGVFSNLAAKPEVNTVEKEEQPPVCHVPYPMKGRVES